MFCTNNLARKSRFTFKKLKIVFLFDNKPFKDNFIYSMLQQLTTVVNSVFVVKGKHEIAALCENIKEVAIFALQCDTRYSISIQTQKS